VHVWREGLLDCIAESLEGMPQYLKTLKKILNMQDFFQHALQVLPEVLFSGGVQR